MQDIYLKSLFWADKQTEEHFLYAGFNAPGSSMIYMTIQVINEMTNQEKLFCGLYDSGCGGEISFSRHQIESLGIKTESCDKDHVSLGDGSLVECYRPNLNKGKFWFSAKIPFTSLKDKQIYCIPTTIRMNSALILDEKNMKDDKIVLFGNKFLEGLNATPILVGKNDVKTILTYRNVNVIELWDKKIGVFEIPKQQALEKQKEEEELENLLKQK